MNKKIYKTIIVGAGISGLGCAHRLIEENSSFKIISPEVGGRITESKNHQVEYGAYYVMNDYLNTLSFVEKGKKIKPTDLVFFKSQKAYKVFDKKLLYHLPQFLKLVLLLREFKKHYQRFKIKCLRQNQVSCLKDDAYLWRLYNLRADVFVKENKLEKIVYDYLAEIIHGTAFLSIKDLNAFEFLHFSLPVIVSTHQFVFQSQKAEALIKKFWLKDKVLEIKKESKIYRLKTETGKVLYCRQLILATPPQVSKKLIKLKQPLREPAVAYMFNLTGKIKPLWKKGSEDVFDEKNATLAIAVQTDKSFLFYSKEARPDFNKYFFNHKIVYKKYWQPAFHIGGSNLVDFEQGENLYMIGDNNICGLEDSCIYGIYAANKILGNTKD